MDIPFWKTVWNEGRTAFHQNEFHDLLLKHFPLFHPASGQKVLVPLCGKSKDLLWLRGLGLEVRGIELSEQAVEAFFRENEIASPLVSRDADFLHHARDGIVISCGDFFQLHEKNTYDFVYDRAALVALPAAMRERYAQVITRVLKPEGKCLLIAYEYDQAKMEGPPFSVDEREIRRLFGKAFDIAPLERRTPIQENARLTALGDGIRETVFVLSR